MGSQAKSDLVPSGQASVSTHRSEHPCQHRHPIAPSKISFWIKEGHQKQRRQESIQTLI